MKLRNTLFLMGLTIGSYAQDNSNVVDSIDLKSTIIDSSTTKTALEVKVDKLLTGLAKYDPTKVNIINHDIKRGPLRNSNIKLGYEIGMVPLEDLAHVDDMFESARSRSKLSFKIVKYF